ncbi:hypothetical protein B0H13DRAFT_2460786 [Mycena leptocephala]|nr:hypothetical protein B0H13DRAFT_2460786 [Mycena leptocephala]
MGTEDSRVKKMDAGTDATCRWLLLLSCAPTVLFFLAFPSLLLRIRSLLAPDPVIIVVKLTVGGDDAYVSLRSGNRLLPLLTLAYRELRQQRPRRGPRKLGLHTHCPLHLPFPLPASHLHLRPHARPAHPQFPVPTHLLATLMRCINSDPPFAHPPTSRSAYSIRTRTRASISVPAVDARSVFRPFDLLTPARVRRLPSSPLLSSLRLRLRLLLALPLSSLSPLSPLCAFRGPASLMPMRPATSPIGLRARPLSGRIPRVPGCCCACMQSLHAAEGARPALCARLPLKATLRFARDREQYERGC